MGLSATELAEAPVGAEEAPEGQKLAGRSPTQIAFERLRKDKMAIVCSAIVVLLVLAAVLAPWICKALNIYPTVESMPYQSSDVLEFGGADNGMPHATARRTTASGPLTRSASLPPPASTTSRGCSTACAPTC